MAMRVVLWNNEKVYRTLTEAMTEIDMDYRMFRKALLEGKWRKVYPVYRTLDKWGNERLSYKDNKRYYDLEWKNPVRAKYVMECSMNRFGRNL